MDATTQDRESLAALADEALGRTPSAIDPIEPGLGTRRFYRLRFDAGDPPTLIGRIEGNHGPAAHRTSSETTDELPAAPVWLAEPPLEPLRSFLEEAGLPVPQSYARDPDRGIDLLEDVGDRTLARARSDHRDALYRDACSLIPRLQRLSAPASRIPAFGRVLDRALIDIKGWKWLHWTMPGLLGRAATAAESGAIRATFGRIASLVEAAPRRLAHRDFKEENLHLVPAHSIGSPAAKQRSGGGGPNRLVMIDFQGAFMAPPEYDLVCLLYDLQVELDEPLAQALFRSTLAELPDAPGLEEASLRFDAIATARLCKDVSHIVQAGLARGDRRRWREIPRGLALLERAVGRLGHTFPEAQTLFSVIHALTGELQSSDSESRGKPG